jgi:hypothetical protein
MAKKSSPTSSGLVKAVYVSSSQLLKVVLMRFRAHDSLLAVLLAMLLLGCSSKPSGSTVKGSVTLDGAPLADGVIHFVANDGSVPTAEAKVAAGQFEAAVPPGEKRVEIRAAKVVGKKKMYETADSPSVDIVEELLPRRYNVDSELKLTVGEGEQVQDFELASK